MNAEPKRRPLRHCCEVAPGTRGDLNLGPLSRLLQQAQRSTRYVRRHWPADRHRALFERGQSLISFGPALSVHAMHAHALCAVCSRINSTSSALVLRLVWPPERRLSTLQTRKDSLCERKKSA